MTSSLSCGRKVGLGKRGTEIGKAQQDKQVPECARICTP